MHFVIANVVIQPIRAKSATVLFVALKPFRSRVPSGISNKLAVFDLQLILLISTSAFFFCKFHIWDLTVNTVYSYSLLLLLVLLYISCFIHNPIKKQQFENLTGSHAEVCKQIDVMTEQLYCHGIVSVYNICLQFYFFTIMPHFTCKYKVFFFFLLVDWTAV